MALTGFKHDRKKVRASALTQRLRDHGKTPRGLSLSIKIGIRRSAGTLGRAGYIAETCIAPLSGRWKYSRTCASGKRKAQPPDAIASAVQQLMKKR